MAHRNEALRAIIRANSDKTNKEIAEIASRELGKQYTIEGIKSQKRRMQQDGSFAVVQEEKQKFQVKEDDVVTWEYRHGVIEISLDTLDQIFYEYSKHGLNLSQTKVQNKHGLTAIQWQSLKRTFDLVKDSDVFTHIRLERHSPEEQCKMIADKIAEKYSPKNMRSVIEYEDNKQRQKAYDKAIKDAAKSDYNRQVFETELLDYVAKAKPVTVKRTKGTHARRHYLCHVCDLHVGADIEAQINLPEYNARVISEKLAKVAEHTNAMDAEKVTVVINGDLIETFTGLNHINSWKNIDKKYGYGVQATILAVEIISDFLSQINNIHEVVIVAGNHDRVTSNNKEDVEGETVQWIHYVLHAKFGHLFALDWSSDVAVRVIDGVCFIITHGHLNISKRPSAEIVNLYGVPGMFCLILEAHLHTRKIKNDGGNYRHLVCPSIFTGNTYSKTLGFTCLSGFVLVYVIDGKPVVIDYPL